MSIILSVGTKTFSMINEIICPVMIVDNHTRDCFKNHVYRIQYTGKRMCLDLSRGWYANTGDEFMASQHNIDTANKYQSSRAVVTTLFSNFAKAC